jgi:hypothetical protein
LREEQSRATHKLKNSLLSSRNANSSSFLCFGALRAPAMFQIGAILVTLDQNIRYFSKRKRGTSKGQLKNIYKQN